MKALFAREDGFFQAKKGLKQPSFTLNTNKTFELILLYNVISLTNVQYILILLRGHI